MLSHHAEKPRILDQERLHSALVKTLLYENRGTLVMFVVLGQIVEAPQGYLPL